MEEERDAANQLIQDLVSEMRQLRQQLVPVVQSQQGHAIDNKAIQFLSTPDVRWIDGEIATLESEMDLHPLARNGTTESSNAGAP